MNKKIKIFVVMLLVAAVLSGTFSLLSCGTDKDSPPGTDDTSDIVNPPERLKLIDSGVSDYVIIYPSNASESLMNSVTVFQKEVKKATGVELKRKDDFLRRGDTADPDAKEILFGLTNRPESKAVFDTLLIEEYAIVKQGNKIVIIAENESYIYAATTYYIKHLLKSNIIGEDGKKTLYFEEYMLKNTDIDNQWLIGGAKLSNYKIIYETERPGYDYAAATLKSIIGQVTGISLTVASDTTESPGTHEILIGKTNRSFSKNYYAQKDPELMNYKFIVDGTNVQIAAGGPYSAYDCVIQARFGVFGAASKHLTSGTLMEKNLLTTITPPPLANGADLRIMTSNILTYVWGEKTDPDTVPPVAVRAEIYGALLAVYRPDVVGVQEADDPWVRDLPYYLDYIKTNYDIDYEWILNKVGGKTNYSSVIYRRDKYDLIDSGSTPMSYWTASRTYHMRILAWGAFKEKADPNKKFVLINTHWAWETDTYNEKSIKEICAEEHAVKAKALAESFKCPVFSTGDFNANPDEQHFMDFLAATDAKNTRDLAKTAGVLKNEIGGCGTVGTARTPGGKFIDHIIGMGSFTVLSQMTIVDNRIQFMSDHAPHIADIKLNHI